ncbi:hypothetical protein N9O57_01300 [bacterium]|nr:hypothetical protein [bacterium]
MKKTLISTLTVILTLSSAFSGTVSGEPARQLLQAMYSAGINLENSDSLNSSTIILQTNKVDISCYIGREHEKSYGLLYRTICKKNQGTHPGLFPLTVDADTLTDPMNLLQKIGQSTNAEEDCAMGKCFLEIKGLQCSYSVSYQYSCSYTK